jgi:hypothetical protein
MMAGILLSLPPGFKFGSSARASIESRWRPIGGWGSGMRSHTQSLAHQSAWSQGEFWAVCTEIALPNATSNTGRIIDSNTGRDLCVWPFRTPLRLLHGPLSAGPGRVQCVPRHGIVLPSTRCQRVRVEIATPQTDGLLDCKINEQMLSL